VRVLDAVSVVSECDHLDVHVEQRGSVQRDEQPRLADVIAGERGQQRTDRGGEVAHVGRGTVVAVATDDNQVEVRELVHCSRHGGAARRDADDALVARRGRE